MAITDVEVARAPGRRRVVIVAGGVAGGMSAATRLRRLDEAAEIVVLERSGHVSFANCGLPYFVGGVIEDEDDLLPPDPRKLFDRFRLDVRVDSEVVAIDRAAHTVTVRSTIDRRPSVVAYDKLVLSMGAAPVRPPHPRLRPGADAADRRGRRRAWPRDVDVAPATAVVIGAGFIGLEMAENLVGQGIDVTIVEATPQVLPPLDPELAVLVEDELVAHGVTSRPGRRSPRSSRPHGRPGRRQALPADLVVGAIGVRPDIRLAEVAGLDARPAGGIAVDDVEPDQRPRRLRGGRRRREGGRRSGGPSLIALANVANRQGRRVADHIAGHPPAPSARRSGPPSSRCSTWWRP